MPGEVRFDFSLPVTCQWIVFNPLSPRDPETSSPVLWGFI